MMVHILRAKILRALVILFLWAAPHTAMSFAPELSSRVSESAEASQDLRQSGSGWNIEISSKDLARGCVIVQKGWSLSGIAEAIWGNWRLYPRIKQYNNLVSDTTSIQGRSCGSGPGTRMPRWCESPDKSCGRRCVKDSCSGMGGPTIRCRLTGPGL